MNNGEQKTFAIVPNAGKEGHPTGLSFPLPLLRLPLPPLRHIRKGPILTHHSPMPTREELRDRLVPNTTTQA